jgi:N utilization substance protein A
LEPALDAQPDDQLSLAIGKKGQNVRLAAKLTGWKIDIISETRAAEAELEELTGGSSQEDESDAGTPVELFSAMSAKDAIATIKSAQSIEDIAGKDAGEERVTVTRAFAAKMAELAGEENPES